MNFTLLSALVDRYIDSSILVLAWVTEQVSHPCKTYLRFS